MIITTFSVENNYNSEVSTPFGMFGPLQTKILSGNSDEVAKMEQFFLGRTGFTFTELGIISRPSMTTLVSGAAIAIDLAASDNFELTLEEDGVLALPANQTIGQKGTIIVKQDAVGGHALTYNAAYLFAGGAAPVITVAASAMDKLTYEVIGEDEILIEVSSQAIATV